MKKERKKLIRLRDNKKMTQGTVAETLGISRSFYGHIEKGTRNPSYGLAKRIANLFEVDVGDLFFDQDSFRVKQYPSKNKAVG